MQIHSKFNLHLLTRTLCQKVINELFYVNKRLFKFFFFVFIEQCFSPYKVCFNDEDFDWSFFRSFSSEAHFNLIQHLSALLFNIN